MKRNRSENRWARVGLRTISSSRSCSWKGAEGALFSRDTGTSSRGEFIRLPWSCQSTKPTARYSRFCPCSSKARRALFLIRRRVCACSEKGWLVCISPRVTCRGSPAAFISWSMSKTRASASRVTGRTKVSFFSSRTSCRYSDRASGWVMARKPRLLSTQWISLFRLLRSRRDFCHIPIFCSNVGMMSPRLKKCAARALVCAQMALCDKIPPCRIAQAMAKVDRPREIQPRPGRRQQKRIRISSDPVSGAGIGAGLKADDAVTVAGLEDQALNERTPRRRSARGRPS